MDTKKRKGSAYKTYVNFVSSDGVHESGISPGEGSHISEGWKMVLEWNTWKEWKQRKEKIKHQRRELISPVPTSKKKRWEKKEEKTKTKTKAKTKNKTKQNKKKKQTKNLNRISRVRDSKSIHIRKELKTRSNKIMVNPSSLQPSHHSRVIETRPVRESDLAGRGKGGHVGGRSTIPNSPHKVGVVFGVPRLGGREELKKGMGRWKRGLGLLFFLRRERRGKREEGRRRGKGGGEKKTNHSHSGGIISISQMNLKRSLKIGNLSFISLNSSEAKQPHHQESQHLQHVFGQEEG